MQGLDAVQLISVIELFVAASISIILGISIIKMYRNKPDRSTLIFLVDFILIGCALAFVAVDRILLSVFGDVSSGLLFHNLAVYISLGVILLLDIFAFQMTYPKQVSKLTIIMVLLLIVAGIMLYFNPPYLGSQNEILYADEMLFLVLPFLALPIFIPIIVFFYSSAKVRDDSVPKSNRLLTMGFAGLFVTIGYIFELMGITGILVIIVRLSFVLFTFLMYIAFIMPNWYKRIIGAEEL